MLLTKKHKETNKQDLHYIAFIQKIREYSDSYFQSWSLDLVSVILMVNNTVTKKMGQGSQLYNVLCF